MGSGILQQLRSVTLSGERSHLRYAPSFRPVLSTEEIRNKNPKLAAVNIVLYQKNNQWFFPLIVRSFNEKDRHSGQISLPGGKKEETDLSFAQTAVRETHEELGIEKHYVRVLREISPIYVPPSNFYVRAFISYTKRNPRFILQKSEVNAVIEFPLERIVFLEEIPELVSLQLNDQEIKVPAIKFGEYTIWGATSMILSELRDLLKKL
ncbi:MAG: CoA pyrophosphatase [Bergeyella sp.]|nr:CoA pyrophosphatase [Bergeyella sp.]